MLSEFQQKKLTLSFNSYDSNGNGFLEKQDFLNRVEALASIKNAKPGSPTYDWAYNKWMKEWDRIQKRADSDQDNQISLQEWLDFHDEELESGDPYWNKREDGITFAEFLFDNVDFDGDGKVSFEESKLSMNAYKVDPSLHEEIFQKLDLNGDGHITKDEWVILLDQFFRDDPDAPGNWLMGPVA